MGSEVGRNRLEQITDARKERCCLFVCLCANNIRYHFLIVFMSYKSVRERNNKIQK